MVFGSRIWLAAVLSAMCWVGIGGSVSAQNGIAQQQGGVEIDAAGVLNLKQMVDPSGTLDRQLALSARQQMAPELQRQSPLRKVSLTRLEQEAKRLIEAGTPLPEDMLQLAGLTRITNVFYYPEEKEIVIAGPAEGFYRNGLNTVVGLESGNATMHLEDLVVALRAFAPDNTETKVIQCSIDPTPEGLVRLRETVAVAQAQFQPGSEMQVVRAFQQALGMQNITVGGVAPETRLARVMVEADYQMKLIGIGLVQPNARVKSFIAGASPMAVARNSLQRWFFQPNYECVHVNADRTAMQLVGSGVKLVGEDERVISDGSRRTTGKVNRASQDFCRTFTAEYDALSRQYPVFGELRNMVDLSIAAAFIQKSGLFAKAEWDMATFADEALIPTQRFNAPRQVAPAINAVWKDGLFMTPIGGGVTIQPRVALNSDRLQEETKGEITAARDAVSLADRKPGQWWWD